MIPSMSSSNALTEKIRQEDKLVAEEKWIINALKQIAEQRNALQIERMHLENMRNNLIKGTSASTENAASVQSEPMQVSTAFEPQPGTSKDNEFEKAFANLDELNNIEELNLSVTNTIRTTVPGFESEEEEDEFDFDNNDVQIDMNMLMLGKF